MRSLWMTLSVWLALAACGACLGGVLSCYTGKAGDLPQWNGWDYFLFCMREWFAFGAIFTIPIAVAVFLVFVIQRR